MIDVTAGRVRSIAIVDECIREVDGQIERLTRARKELAQAREGLSEIGTGKAAKRAAMRAEIVKLALDPRQQAGEENIAKVEEYLRRHGRAYQSAIRKDCGLASGTDTWTLRALAAEGKIRATGESFRGSAEFAYIAPRRETVVEAGRGVRSGRKLEAVK